MWSKLKLTLDRKRCRMNCSILYRNVLIKQKTEVLPNQKLSGAKSELQGEAVGACSSYKRGGQPPYNSALRSLQVFLFVHI